MSVYTINYNVFVLITAHVTSCSSQITCSLYHDTFLFLFCLFCTNSRFFLFFACLKYMSFSGGNYLGSKLYDQGMCLYASLLFLFLHLISLLVFSTLFFLQVLYFLRKNVCFLAILLVCLFTK